MTLKLEGLEGGTQRDGPNLGERELRGGMVDDRQAERNVTMWAWEGTCRVGYFKIAEMEALLRGPETTGKMGTKTKRQERLVHLHLRQGQAMECPHVGMLGGLTILRILRVVVEALRAWTRWGDRLEWEEKEQRGININVHQHQYCVNYRPELVQ
ncbi:hypothetical protein C8J57DRAFT_1580455 [Mycena rebaudengoi]|nr:hypothetical protein C8J57DRAFT_1580455 [Mycena rebaudengoi]